MSQNTCSRAAGGNGKQVIQACHAMTGSKKDWQKAMDAYVSMEEEGITPRVRTQRYLANVLKSCDQPIPFQVPEVREVRVISARASSQTAYISFTALLSTFI